MTVPDVLVQARGLGKSYPRVSRRSDRLRALGSLLLGRQRVESVPVLSGVDLEVRRGESVGLIGENGAGKSTLLKLISGVLTPSHGTLAVHGRIGALLELGAGFHLEYTGRENVAMAAALYGLSAGEIRARQDDILAFADIGRYIDEPVKHYSSGMVVRLGFAIVAAIRPDLLITDEVLAVGDEAFQKKCIQWIEEYLDTGGTLLLVSHSMYHIQKLCRHACWLRDGRIEAQGDVFDVTQAYLAYSEHKQGRALAAGRQRHGEFLVENLRLNGVDGESVPLAVDVDSDLVVEAEVHSRDGRVPHAMVGIARGDGSGIYGVASDMETVQLTQLAAGRYRVAVKFTRLPLLPAQYVVRVHALDPEGLRVFDTCENLLTVRGNTREAGSVRLEHTWLS
ncbi:MAG TPA: ABC transporter ATP-binding protein [Rhodanobacteraceae bacterium]|nr:ABC transporter ATP-binding protein [Rhodanobacteraceae bacterium]